MGTDEHKKACDGQKSLPHSPKKQKGQAGKMKEEISLELAEFGNLNPKYEPMTQNDRQKSESEKTYR